MRRKKCRKEAAKKIDQALLKLMEMKINAKGRVYSTHTPIRTSKNDDLKKD